MFGVAVTVAALSALASAPPTNPRAVVVAWDSRGSTAILSRLVPGTDSDMLKTIAKEQDFRIDFVGGDAYCFQTGMMGERDLIAQRAVYEQITRTANSQHGLIDHRRLGTNNWAALRARLASLLAKERVTERELDNSRIVVIPDNEIQMRGGDRKITFYPASSSQPQAGDITETATGLRASWTPVPGRHGLANTSMTVLAADLGPMEQAVLFRQAAEMIEHHIALLVDDVALAQKAAYEALAADAKDDKIDDQAANLSVMPVEMQAYIANSFCNSYRWFGFADANQARAFVGTASFDKIRPVMVMMLTIPMTGGGVKTVTVVLPTIEMV